MSNNNIILNRMFTRTTFSQLIDKNNKACYLGIINKYIEDIKLKSNGEIITELYKFMEKEYRNEYFYKNTLFNKLVLGRHSLRTTKALTEVPIGKSKADFITINNKAIVYEIKTDLDTFERLDTQLSDYYKAFTSVSVVTCEKNYERIYEMLKDSKVGICILTEKNTLSVRKKPLEEYSYLDYTVIFKILRKYEFENILLSYYGKLPQVTPAFYYDECIKLFRDIDINLAYKYLISELKKRIYIEEENFKRYIPYELRFLAYFSEYRENDYVKLGEFLKERADE